MKTTLKLNFKVDEQFLNGVKNLQKALNFCIAEDGVEVVAVEGDKVGVMLNDNKAIIYYVKKHHFFRELSVLCENLRVSNDFAIFEDSFFETISTMVDASRNGAPTVDAMCRFLDRIALMGYNQIMFYLEDMLELEGRPYFGHMRGRYNAQEIKAIDDYAYNYGIEIVPCLECYGHMEKYLIWPEADAIRDTSSVMLAREEKTFEFVELLVSTARKCFRSNNIHIGMDEAWDMGRGVFLTKNGYVPPFEIFTEYMERLIAITDKYGFTAYMWSDMYFRICDKSGNQLYYEKETEIPKEIADKIPAGVKLVFWHYGEGPFCDDFMLKKHKDLNREVMFAGGTWSWIGHFPDHDHTMMTNKFSLQACRNNDVKEAMLTLWFNDNMECNLFANLFDLSYFAELCYNKDVTDKQLRSRFYATTGCDYDAFYAMQFYHNKFEEGETYANYNHRYLGKPLFWQDILEGLYDSHLFARPMSAHYKKNAEFMKNYIKLNDDFSYLYKLAYAVFDYLALKTEIAEKLVPAYKNNDLKTLKTIAKKLLPALLVKAVKVKTVHKKVWFNDNKTIGWCNLDIRYGGVIARCQTAIEQLNDYLNGKIDKIDGLEVERLTKPLSGFIGYNRISSPNLKT
ncbi:MAG: family 20 glycosylhydrolase [Clostridia bacterium]|nr:family 20 glycosylhydrolase [Clostridia bacterium]